MFETHLQRAINQPNLVLTINLADVVKQSRNDEIVGSGFGFDQRLCDPNEVRTIVYWQSSEVQTL